MIARDDASGRSSASSPRARSTARWCALTASLSWPEFVFLALQIAPEPVTIALLAPAGTETVAAFRALSLVSDITWSLPGALGDASEVVLGQRIGARDYAGAKTFQRDATRLARAGVPARRRARRRAGVAARGDVHAEPRARDARGGAAGGARRRHAAAQGLRDDGARADPRRRRHALRHGDGHRRPRSSRSPGSRPASACCTSGSVGVPFGWTAGWLVRGAITTLRLRGGDWQRRALAASDRYAIRLERLRVVGFEDVEERHQLRALRQHRMMVAHHFLIFRRQPLERQRLQLAVRLLDFAGIDALAQPRDDLVFVGRADARRRATPPCRSRGGGTGTR